jgi:hypothetical protein
VEDFTAFAELLLVVGLGDCGVGDLAGVGDLVGVGDFTGDDISQVAMAGCSCSFYLRSRRQYTCLIPRDDQYALWMTSTLCGCLEAC